MHQIGRKGLSNQRWIVGGKLGYVLNQWGLIVDWEVETVLSMLTNVCHFKKARHRVWKFFRARLAYVMAAYNICVQWRRLQPNDSGFIPLSIAEASL